MNLSEYVKESMMLMYVMVMVIKPSGLHHLLLAEIKTCRSRLDRENHPRRWIHLLLLDRGNHPRRWIHLFMVIILTITLLITMKMWKPSLHRSALIKRLLIKLIFGKEIQVFYPQRHLYVQVVISLKECSVVNPPDITISDVLLEKIRKRCCFSTV